ncbi:hypothetical protein [Paenibacillus sp. Leaf72]|uniref:hypothetical protein n=1 Tax=Paenibacillus sp. Leaf72 TaxID=1736234 RepID=UPI0006F2E382|nr:hypothetical protein [Paenibacillus sp. Leaf72]KQN99065.1 hypothetical protein ASF12_20050 [Paenibacillus sp. Leaf72]
MTKNNKTKKSSLMVTSSLLVAIMLATAACSSNSNNAPAASSSPVATDEQPATVSPTPEESAAPSPSDGGSVTEPGEASPESSSGTDTPTANPDLKTGEGVFNGLIDTHSIEVDTPNGTIVLQINDELLDVINSLPEKSKIKYQYVEKDLDGFTQMWAEKIEKQ